MSYGYTEEEAKNMSEKDVLNLLFSDNEPSKLFLNKVVSPDEVEKGMATIREIQTTDLMNLGYNQKDIDNILANDINWVIGEEHEKSNIDKSLNSILESKELTSADTKSSSNHIWYGSRPYGLLNEWNCYFHGDVYPTTVYTPSPVNVGYAPATSDLGYTEKVDLLEADTQKVTSYAKELYNVSNLSAYKYNYFNYGELMSTSRTHTHEGIDTRRFSGRGQTIYSPINRIGVVSLAILPTDINSKDTSYLGIYYADLDLTLIYQHVKFSSAYTPNVTVIGGNTSFATEWTFGEYNGNNVVNHVHLQIQRGKITSKSQVYLNTDSAGELESLNPYNFLLYY